MGPRGWGAPKSVGDNMSDFAAGMDQVSDSAKKIFGGMFQQKYTGLAAMLSESVSKWAVCPVRESANKADLDANLGVEDSAFHDFQKEAYSKWTGYKKAIPGEKCEDLSSFGIQDSDMYQGCQV